MIMLILFQGTLENISGNKGTKLILGNREHGNFENLF